MASAWPPHATCQACGSGSPRSLGIVSVRCSGSGQFMTTEIARAPSATSSTSRRVIGLAVLKRAGSIAVGPLGVKLVDRDQGAVGRAAGRLGDRLLAARKPVDDR